MDRHLLNYVFVGNKNKPVIMFLHGFMGSCVDFQEVANLVASDFCCLLVDLPGHGKTRVKCERDYLMPEVAQATIELLTKLKIERCFLVGYSMGGRLALYLTLHFPQYFTKTILESASPGLKTQAERDNRIKQDLKVINKLKTTDFEIFLEQWYKNPLFTIFRRHPNYQQAIARRLKNNPEQLSKSLRYMGLGMQPSLWGKLQTNKIPLLSIVGSCDRKFIIINQKIVNLAFNTNLKIVKNADHNVHSEHPLIFARLLKDFLNPA